LCFKWKNESEKAADKNMMNNLVWVKIHSFLSAAMSFFCYQNLNTSLTGNIDEDVKV
jgi:hypothetical protein